MYPECENQDSARTDVAFKVLLYIPTVQRRSELMPSTKWRYKVALWLLKVPL
jgi:hypothetical protein